MSKLTLLWTVFTASKFSADAHLAVTVSPCACCVQTKQDWHLTLNSNFDATKNTRNVAMLADAAELAQHLRLCERDIQNVKGATEGSLAPAASNWPDCQAGCQAEKGRQCQQDLLTALQKPGHSTRSRSGPDLTSGLGYCRPARDD